MNQQRSGAWSYHKNFEILVKKFDRAIKDKENPFPLFGPQEVRIVWFKTPKSKIALLFERRLNLSLKIPICKT